MISQDILTQVRQVFADLSQDFTFLVHAGKGDEKGAQMHEFVNDVVSASPRLHKTGDENGELSFELLKGTEATGIIFRGIPNGHEFSSLLLSVLNADGKGKNLPDERLKERISRIKGPVRLQTYVSLTCTNCPDVVQALNAITLLRPDFTHEITDGALFQQEVENRGIQAVPAVYANGELIHVGAGVSAAIYCARKALRVALVAGRIGGQVNDTTGIENLISVPHTSGSELAANLRSHLEKYDIDIFDNRKVEGIDHADERLKHVNVKGGETFVAPAVIIATGASWRRLGVEGESTYLGHGVHFCPHCDGPFYKGKRVAVIGGGNSGIEAAIDLAALASHVTVVEFADVLRADDVLLDKVRSLGNVDILVSRQTMEVKGNGEKLTAITLKDRKTEELSDLEVDGIFVQIGLSPNSDFVRDLLPLSARREIIIDDHCRTSVKGIYAAGDVSSVPFKQIIISMGEGAKAALSAHEDWMRGLL